MPLEHLMFDNDGRKFLEVVRFQQDANHGLLRKCGIKRKDHDFAAEELFKVVQNISLRVKLVLVVEINHFQAIFGAFLVNLVGDDQELNFRQKIITQLQLKFFLAENCSLVIDRSEEHTSELQSQF